MIAAVLVFAALAAAPARAQKPSDQLCALTNCSGIDFGRYRGAPTIERPARERCPECEEAAQRRLAESLATMRHPTPVVPLAADTRAILREDVIQANAGMAMIAVGLGSALSAELLLPALLVGAGLMALNAALDPRYAPLPAGVRIPVWLNMISFTRAPSAASKSCADLAAAAQGSCAGLAESACNEKDDCRTLLDKRAPRLACDRAWLDLRNGQCPVPDADYRSMSENARQVADCGRMISSNPKCCPKGVTALKEEACKKRGGLRNCADENDLSENELLGLSPDAQAAHCRSALAKQELSDKCRAAREAEGSQCYEGQLDGGHAQAVDQLRTSIAGCESFLAGARRLGLCR